MQPTTITITTSDERALGEIIAYALNRPILSISIPIAPVTAPAVTREQNRLVNEVLEAERTERAQRRSMQRHIDQTWQQMHFEDIRQMVCSTCGADAYEPCIKASGQPYPGAFHHMSRRRAFLATKEATS